MAAFLKNITLISQSAALYRDRELKDAGVTGYQARYVLAVCNNPGITQEGLAKYLFVNKSNVARQISALEENGYVYREQFPQDKRAFCVYPTEKAQKIFPVIKRINAEWRKVVCKGLTEEEEKTLAALVEKLVANASEYIENHID